MDYLLVNGGKRLRGTVQISGAKNAALPIMAACLMIEGQCVLRGVPSVSDVEHLSLLLRQLGMRVER